MSARNAPNPSGAPPLPDQGQSQQDPLSVLLGVSPKTVSSKTDSSKTDSSKAKELAEVQGSISQVLSESGGTVPLNELAGKVNVDFVTLSDALADLEDRSVVTIDGTPGDEIIEAQDESSAAS